MGTSHRRDDMHAKWERAARDREAVAAAQAIIDYFNLNLATGKKVWAWPTIEAALATKNHWLIVACDSCSTITDLDLTMKKRELSRDVRIALRDIICLRCNGSGRPRIIALQGFPTA